MSFKARTTAPSETNKFWVHVSNHGLNECIEINKKTGSCIPNCVGYAWGRFYEILGKKPKLCKANAEMWYGYDDGYKRGKTPKLGAVICWSKGKVGNKSDGAGHVAIVEKINGDGSIVTSNSGYGSTRFYMKKINKNYELNGYKFQGFIYNPAVIDDDVTPVKDIGDNINYRKGDNYKLVSNVKVRVGAGTKYDQKTVSQLSKNGQKHATSTDLKALAVLKKGTVVTCQAVITSGDTVWLKIPSGYILAKDNKGVYVL